MGPVGVTGVPRVPLRLPRVPLRVSRVPLRVPSRV